MIKNETDDDTSSPGDQLFRASAEKSTDNKCNPFQAAGHFSLTEIIVTHDIKIQAGSPLYVHIDRNKKARAERKLAKREANRVVKRGKIIFLD